MYYLHIGREIIMIQQALVKSLELIENPYMSKINCLKSKRRRFFIALENYANQYILRLLVFMYQLTQGNINYILLRHDHIWICKI